VFRPVHPNGHSVIVVPGGSYEFVSIANEGLDPARKLAESGSTVFVLTYRLPGEGWANRSAVPLQDAQRAMRIVRSHASQLAIDPDKVGILGFSAGGHLAATLATQHFEHTYDPIDAIDELDARPHTAGLIYPVVTMQTPWTHEISRRRLLGDSPSPTEIARRSAEQQVGPATVPVFLVHAFDDRAVPIENSLRLMEAMRTAQRPIEAHLLQEGGHAFGTGYPGSPSAHWCSLYSSWVSRVT
jgi:acetyl esterase/lipase